MNIFGSTLRTYDKAGKKRVVLEGEDGSLTLTNDGAGPAFSLYDSAEKKRVHLSNDLLSMIDSAGTTRIRLKSGYIPEEHSKIEVNDPTGKVQVALTSFGSVEAYDTTPKLRVHLLGSDGSVRAKDKAGKARVSLLGTTGKVSFTAPNGKTISHP